MEKLRTCLVVWMLFPCWLLSCNSNDKLFVSRDVSDTGITFTNTITENDSVNVLDYYYCYNGGGVAAGDFNNDGLIDIFFGGNMVSSALYINKGKLSFEDVTTAAGLTTSTWILGISVVDINNDGWLDIYLNVADPRDANAPNLLFINQGNHTSGVPSFQEEARLYGLDIRTFSVQSAFLDYDRDGDLDMYLLTNQVNALDKNYVHQKSYPLTKGATIDRLYQNTGINATTQRPIFTDVSKDANIVNEGYGLGLVVDDFNTDGWPDVYASNDFMPNDHCYINQQNGTFKDEASAAMGHQSYNGMGTDAADINNDLLPDLMVVDMLPPDNARRKAMIGNMNYEKFLMERRAGYIPQFARNTLQLNRGNRNGTPQFSEIACMSGVQATDWSWSSLFNDFDNDGIKDIYVTNGFVKDITDLDFINYQASTALFGKIKLSEKYALIERLKGVKIPNYIFRGRGDLTFEDMTTSWSDAEPSFSNGAVCADLDNDGDIDIVTSNINHAATVWENQTRSKENPDHFLTIRLKGTDLNRNAIGATIQVFTKTKSYYAYASPVRGYLSSAQVPLHIGLGRESNIDSVVVKWDNKNTQVVKNVAVNQTLMLNVQDARHAVHTSPAMATLFTEANNLFNIHATHVENPYNDFAQSPLLPRLYSRNGPGVAVGDINRDNHLDFFVTGSAGSEGQMFIQREDGKFDRDQKSIQKSGEEDAAALFFDADNDGDDDLYIVSGGNEFRAEDEHYRDRLYINDNGNFTSQPARLPDTRASGSCVIGADFDRDGDIDLFVGGRISPGAYPEAPKSYLLRNDKGNFTDVSATVAPGLDHAGMITAALWSDFNNDNLIDLIVVGEWMPITFFKNTGAKFINVTEQLSLQHTTGWWNSIQGADIDNDGDTDYILGNSGLNQEVGSHKGQPANLYTKDFDNNGRPDFILTHSLPDASGQLQSFPFHGRDDMARQLPFIKRKFNTYEQFGKATVETILTESALAEASHLTASIFETSLLLNMGQDRFTLSPLPLEAQLSATHGIAAEDFDNDDELDLLLTGNSLATEIGYGWQDASHGLYLRGDGRGNFKPAPSTTSGLYLTGDTKGIASLHSIQGKKVLVVTSNADSIRTLTTGTPKKIFTALPQDCYANIFFSNGKHRRHEFYYGSGYYAQSARVIGISSSMQYLQITDFKGHQRKIILHATKNKSE